MKSYAYSLWAQSAWFAYWSTESGTTLDTQVCTINGKNFYYKQIKEHWNEVINGCMKEAETISVCERKKLEEAVEKWMADMEDKFHMTIDKGMQK